MNTTTFSLLLVLLSVLLTGCPYREIYKYQGGPVVDRGVEIVPLTFFFSERKDSASCTPGFRITNKGNQEQKFNFRNAYLFSGRDTAFINGVYFTAGQLSSPENELSLPPAKDTVIGLLFIAKPNRFQSDLNLFFSSQAIGDRIIEYDRIR